MASGEDMTLATRFDSIYLNIAHSPVRERIQREAYGDEYPAEVQPHGLVTWSELRRMAREIAVGAGQTFVDLGCGEGGAGLWLAHETGASVIGIDISPVAIQRARERIADFRLVARARFETGDIAALPLPSVSCDGAISVDVIWMVSDRTAVFGEAARVLRPGARLLVTTWEFPQSELPRSNEADYRRALSQVGFEVEAYDAAQDWKEQFRKLVAAHEAARDDLAQEFGDEMADSMIEFERQRAALLPDWRRVFIRARRL